MTAIQRYVCLFAMPLMALAADAWPRWRGPAANGMAAGDAPVEWSDSKNVAWKAEIPGRGMSSPVLWGERVFVTTAVPIGEAPAPAPQAESRRGRRGPGGGDGARREHKFLLMAFDRSTGKKLWEQVAITTTPHEGFHQRYGSFASYSPITDGKRVYAMFGSRGLYAYSLDGKPLWKTQFKEMRMRNQFGEGAPPTLAGNMLILNFDQENDSYIAALDASNGKEIWRMNRDEPSSWSQPLVITHKGVEQVILSATNRVRSYELKTGKLLWECGGLGTNVIPAPVVHNDSVIVMSGHRSPNMMALKLGGSGDLTGTDAVLWTNQRGNSYTPSPVLHDGKLYFVSDNGMLSCLDAATGKPYYAQQRLGDKPYNFKASPVGANGKLYLSTEQGDVVVVRMGEKYEVLAVNSMADEMFVASPAIVDGSIYLRGVNTLYCIRN